jgi:hypothetical protein
MQCAMLWRGTLCCATRRGAAVHDAAEWSAAEGKWLKTLRGGALHCVAQRSEALRSGAERRDALRNAAMCYSAKRRGVLRCAAMRGKARRGVV